jgi:hypothetical protein
MISFAASSPAKLALPLNVSATMTTIPRRIKLSRNIEAPHPPMSMAVGAISTLPDLAMQMPSRNAGIKARAGCSARDFSARLSGFKVGSTTMSIRVAFIASLLGIFGYASMACAANSCANVVSFGSNDESGLRESEFGIYAVGTFRIAGEVDENKQPNFNLSTVDCEKQSDDTGRASLECKVTQAVVWATEDKPNTDNPNCSLDLDTSSYSMKELQKGTLTGIAETSGCFNTLLTIDRNTKRVYLSFTRTQSADNYDRIKPGTCGGLPRTEVLMNCTSWARSRKGGGPPRYCDFSSSSDK